MTDSITKAIDDLVEQKLLSGEGFKAIDAIRERAEALESDLEAAHDEIAKQTAKTADAALALSLLKNEHNGLSAQHNTLKEREGEIAANETKAAVATARADTAIDMFRTVFANVIVKKAVFGSASLPDSNGYATSHPSSSEETTEESA